MAHMTRRQTNTVHRSVVDVPAMTEQHKERPQEMAMNLCEGGQDLS